MDDTTMMPSTAHNVVYMNYSIIYNYIYIILIEPIINFQIKSGKNKQVITVVGGPYSRTEKKKIWRVVELSTNCEVRIIL